VKYQKIANSIRKHAELRGFMLGALTEQTFIADDPVTGVQVRCRSDMFNRINDYCVLVDLKSAEDARPGPFGRACYNYGYFHQDAFYRDVVEWATGDKIDLFLFTAFEKEPPYAVKLYQSTDAAIERARGIYRKALNTAALCLDSGKWPAYETDIEPLDYPAWARD